MATLSGQDQTTLPYLSDALLGVLSNQVVFDNVLPYLSLSSLFALSRTCRSAREIVLRDPKNFRHLDLSRCRGAFVSPSVTRIDSGGHSWRAERMDENLTEDEFYAGPLRGVLSKLTRLNIVSSVYTLIIDGLASVTLDLVSDLLQSTTYNIRILSVVQCINLNQRRLQQLLHYICRPSRPKSTPCLKGLYIFGQIPGGTQFAVQSTVPLLQGITQIEGAQLGASPSSKAQAAASSTDPLYLPTGRVVTEGHASRSTWEETLQVCKGIVAFDAVLCTHMHAAMEPHWHEASREFLGQHKPGIFPIATMALGPHGCAGCGSAPPGTPTWGSSDPVEFPLLRPPPFSGRLIDAVRPPLITSAEGGQLPRRFIASCAWCLTNRHCEGCHKWWCGDCFYTKKTRTKGQMNDTGANLRPTLQNSSSEDILGCPSSSIKVFNNLCVEHCVVGEWMAGAGGNGMWG